MIGSIIGESNPLGTKCDDFNPMEDGLDIVRVEEVVAPTFNTMSRSITSPFIEQKVFVEDNPRPIGIVSREEINIPGKRSMHGAIQKLKRRLNRSKRKLRKKKLLTELG